MPLIKDGKLADDPWIAADDDAGDADVESPAPLIVGLETWRARRQALGARAAPLGLRLRSDEPPALVADDLEHFSLVALEFPKFTDGRAYSYARLLRERYGYGGELRAVGQVLRDQLLFMHRCGFDAFELADDDAARLWLEAMAEISVTYQPAADDRVAVTALRGDQGRTKAA